MLYYDASVGLSNKSEEGTLQLQHIYVLGCLLTLGLSHLVGPGKPRTAFFYYSQGYGAHLVLQNMSKEPDKVQGPMH